MTFYMFTRRAKNASHSNRTKKLGQLHGTFEEALRKAAELCSREKEEITATEYDTGKVTLILRMGSDNTVLWARSSDFKELI